MNTSASCTDTTPLCTIRVGVFTFKNSSVLLCLRLVVEELHLQSPDAGVEDGRTEAIVFVDNRTTTPLNTEAVGEKST